MPKLAKDEKFQCCAFDKSDHRRCRLKREAGQLTCKIHRSYYTNWRSDHPPLMNDQLTQRRTEELRFQFKNGYVTPVSPNEFALWFMTQNYFGLYTNYILLLLEYTNFTLAHYPDYVRSLVAAEIGARLHLPLEEQMVSWQRLLPYLKDAETMRIFLDSVVETVVNHSFMIHDHIHLSVVFSAIINGPLPWSLLLYSQNISTVSARVFQTFTTSYALSVDQRVFIQNFLRDYIDVPLLHFHNSHRFLIRHRCHQVKEEIMMNIMHPRRIERLINEHGIDILDDLWG